MTTTLFDRLYAPVESKKVYNGKPSEKQIAKIKELTWELDIPEPNYNSLTGGSGGTASRLIDNLIKQQMLNPNMTKKQIKFVEEMFLCPDVQPVDYTGWTKEQASEWINSNMTAYNIWRDERPTSKQMEEMKRLYTELGEEFDETSLIQLSKNQASGFIKELYKELSRVNSNVEVLKVELKGLSSELEALYKAFNMDVANANEETTNSLLELATLYGMKI